MCPPAITLTFLLFYMQQEFRGVQKYFCFVSRVLFVRETFYLYLNVLTHYYILQLTRYERNNMLFSEYTNVLSYKKPIR